MVLLRIYVILMTGEYGVIPLPNKGGFRGVFRFRSLFAFRGEGGRGGEVNY